MPIAREHRWLYPIDWRELSALVRFDRARGKCERCRRPHGCELLHLGNGTWWDEAAKCWRDDRGRGVRRLPTPAELARRQPGLPGIGAPASLARTRVVLASAHLNHDPGDNRLRNLAALCQRCHMRHDAPEHRRRRWHNAFRVCALGDLFGERQIQSVTPLSEGRSPDAYEPNSYALAQADDAASVPAAPVENNTLPEQ